MECRGPATLEVEDTVTVVQDDVDTNILFNIKGQSKTFHDNSFTVTFDLEDSTVRTSEVRHDIGLRFDTGLKMDGG